jgi:hypothetical protein
MGFFWQVEINIDFYNIHKCDKIHKSSLVNNSQVLLYSNFDQSLRLSLIVMVKLVICLVVSNHI